MKEKIFDKNVNLNNFASFKKSMVTDNGKSVKFTMACGVNYDVPLTYILKWFSSPHYFIKNSKTIAWDAEKYREGKLYSNNIRVTKIKRVLSKTVIRLYLNNNTAYDVAWDTVLMACEPQYEHFGGLTKQSQKMVNKWFKEWD